MSDNKWLRANQYAVMNYSSTCYIIQPSNHLYLLRPNSSDVLAVTDFQSQYHLLLTKASSVLLVYQQILMCLLPGFA